MLGGLIAALAIAGSMAFQAYLQIAGGREGTQSTDAVTADFRPAGPSGSKAAPAAYRPQASRAVVSGEQQRWHKVTLTFDGPETAEGADPNPFRDYRLDVTFTKGGRRVTVPGYFAADGNAAETSAERGGRWRAHFLPDEEGTWEYRASFRTGRDIAISPEAAAGYGVAGFDGASGRIVIRASNKRGRDFRAQGLLRYTGQRYLRFAGSGRPYLKGGADSPENFLAYYEFDGTRSGRGSGQQRRGEAAAIGLHRYEPHVRDWRSGDPSWQKGKGKGIIGALNYLASEGMNSVYFLTMNVGGDGRDVWPWTGEGERFRFDCSKLDQWEIVFEHMDRLGLILHVITQETENDQLLDGGALGPERRLYYRELIARFAHHPALVWNLGEENANTDEERKAFSRYIRDLDPYDHPIVVHTYPGQYDLVYKPLLGFAALEGPSLQIGRMDQTHAETLKWVERSAKDGRPWFVSLDEIGPANVGVVPDSDDPDHDEVRHHALWGNLMAGGAGCEWYFGYQHAHNDLNCEDWRSRDRMWDQTRYALEFFHRHLPFTEMSPGDDLTGSARDYCFAAPGRVYAIYLPGGETTDLDLGSSGGRYTVRWYNPRRGGDLQAGSVKSVQGPGRQQIGSPPSEPEKDWVALVTTRT
jgi:hypothetical protein